MFMSEAIQEFGFDCKIRKLSPKTIANYQKQMKYLQRYLDSEFGVKEVEGININNTQALAEAFAEAIKKLPINIETSISDIRLVVNGEAGRRVIVSLDN